MAGSILVPLDGSTFSEAALPLAVALARAAAAPLDLLHVRQSFLVEGAEVWTHHPGSHPVAYLESVATSARRAGVSDVVTHVLEGAVVDRVLDHIGSSGARMVVLSTHGRGGVARAWLGSVADRLVRASPAPLLLVRPGSEPVADLGAGRLPSCILLPVDGSEEAESAVGPVVELAATLGSAVTLLRVVEEPIPEGLAFLAEGPRERGRLVARAAEVAGRYLEALKERFGRPDVEVLTQLAVDGRPAEVIIEYARGAPVDMVALCSRGRGGFERLILGSVADKVVRGCDKPVLVLGPPRRP